MIQRRMLYIGIFFFALGCFGLFYRVTRMHLFFLYDLNLHGASLKFQRIDCSPSHVQINQTSYVTVTIANPINEALMYTIGINEQVSGYQIESRSQRYMLPGLKTDTITWPVTPTKPGDILVTVGAISDKDLAIDNPYLHSYPTSFIDRCWIVVITEPQPGLPDINWYYLSLLIGVIFSLPAVYGSIRRKRVT